MSAQITDYPFFTDTDGSALATGRIWIGTVNTDPRQNPVAVFYDAALTLPAAQPLAVLNGRIMRGGSITNVYTSQAYSIYVENQHRANVYYNANVVPLKQRIDVSVTDFGAPTGGDDSAAFQAAVNALPTGGGTIDVPDGAYVLNTAPTWGTKSVYWNIGLNAAFSGTQTTFPTMVTNAGVIAVGPWLVSQSSTQATANNGTAAFCVEAIQPAALNGGVSGIYAGCRLLNAGNQSIGLAANFVATAEAGSSGNVWALELDIGNYATAGVGNSFGLSINGLGTSDVTFAIKIQRADTSHYLYGIDMQATRIGIFIENTANHENAIVAGSIPTRFPGNTIMLGQLSNNTANAALLLQRFTDTSPAGYLINAVNTANTATLFSVDALGGLTANLVTSPRLTLTQAAAAVATGSVQLGAFTATTATAGAASLPAAPLGFLVAYLGATPIKIPYYNT